MKNKKDYKKLFNVAIKELKNTVPDFRKSDYIFVVSGDVINEKIKYKGVDIRFDNRLNGETFYLIKRLENGECCKHSSNKVVAYNRDYLDENLEMEFDILKTTRDTVQAMRKGASDDEVAERLAKVVEPYERKE